MTSDKYRLSLSTLCCATRVWEDDLGAAGIWNLRLQEVTDDIFRLK